MATSRDMTWQEREQCQEFVVMEDGTSLPLDEANRKASEAHLRKVLGDQYEPIINSLRQHPYIKAIQRFCQPPWYVRLYRKIFRS